MSREANILSSTTNCDSGISMNCACNGQITLNGLVFYINKNLGREMKAVYEKVRQGDIKHSFADIRLAKKKLSYNPSVDFEKGLKLTIQSFSNKL